MPKPDLGAKRTCPETGKKFYDLNKDPIVSPFTGKQYPRSYFEEVIARVVKAAPKIVVKDDEDEAVEEEDVEELEDEDVEEDEVVLDEEPIDLGDDEEDDDPAAPKRAAADDDELEGFSDDAEDAELADDAEILLDDDEDDDLADEIDLGGPEEDEER